MQKNVASQVAGVQMVTAADGSAFTGSVTVVVTGDGGTQSASGGTGPTHEGNGFHTYLPTQAETNFDHIGFTYTGSGAIPVTVQVYTGTPQTADHTAGIAAIPTTAMRGTDNAATEAKQDTMQSAIDTVTKVGPTKAEMDTAHALLATPAEVNAEVLDVLNVDTFAEPGQGAPAATASLVTKIGYLYKQWRNRKNQTATTQQLFADDASTVDQKATVSDNATTTEVGEMGTGP